MIHILGLALIAVLFLAGVGMISYLWFDTRNKIGYIPMPALVIEAVLDVLDLKSGDTLIDLGAGDGRVLTAVARRTPRVQLIGYENNPFLRAPRGVEWHRADLFGADLNHATHVVAYLNDEMNARLAKKLKAELVPGAVVMTVQFGLPGWTAERTIEIEGAPAYAMRLYIYKA